MNKMLSLFYITSLLITIVASGQVNETTIAYLEKDYLVGTETDSVVVLKGGKLYDKLKSDEKNGHRTTIIKFESDTKVNLLSIHNRGGDYLRVSADTLTGFVSRSWVQKNKELDKLFNQNIYQKFHESSRTSQVNQELATRCHGTTKKGKQCKRTVKSGEYCWQHR